METLPTVGAAVTASGGPIFLRKINRKSASLAALAFDADSAPALFHDAVDGGQAESSAFARSVGGEKRLEDTGLGFGVHAFAGVDDFECDVGSRREIGDRRGVVEDRTLRAHDEAAAARHGVAGIDPEIDDDLFDLAGIGFDTGQRGFELGDDLEVFANDPLQKTLEVGNDDVEIDDARLKQLFAAEGQKLSREASGLLARLMD